MEQTQMRILDQYRRRFEMICRYFDDPYERRFHLRKLDQCKLNSLRKLERAKKV
jgi:hypothetical protein